MPPKSKNKALSTWYRCEICRVVLAHKDVTLHEQGNCPPPEQSWNHGFIKKKIIHSWLSEALPDMLNNASQEELINSIWISSSVLKMCGLCVGEPVLIEAHSGLTVKTVWPIREKSLSRVLMSKEGLEFVAGSNNAPVRIRKLPGPFPPAHELVVVPQNEDILVSSHIPDILLILRRLYCGTFIQQGSVLLVPHYGRHLKFVVESVNCLSETIPFGLETRTALVDSVAESFQQLSFNETKPELKGFCSTPIQSRQKNFSCAALEKSVDPSISGASPIEGRTPVRKAFRKMTEDSYVESTLNGTPEGLSFTCSTSADSYSEGLLSGIHFYHIAYSSQWRVKSTIENEETPFSNAKTTLSSIGGLEKVIEELVRIMQLALRPSQKENFGLKVARGVLLHGPPGTGKTILAHALASEAKAATHIVQGAELFSRLLGETETKLREFFSTATTSGPAVIILDEIDSLCPKKTSSTGSTELERRVVSTLSTLLDGLHSRDAFVIATTSRLDSVDPVIRRPGRLDHEMEIPVPSPDARVCILTKLLHSVPHSLSVSEIKSIAEAAHGFVGADLASLVSQAGVRAYEYSDKGSTLAINVEHMKWALLRIHPSAMREVLVDVPNVRWSDIGGQEDLKLKLKQAVEWPLTHPEAFTRLGIRPPKGVLMFGPPGCSKTMIAKALATESKLNFLSIKGPELFSKWVGESERAVRELFRKARLVAPAIIFFDEIDALGGERSTSGGMGGSNVQERVLAQLLTEMDGVTALENVTVVAATNRPDRIDKALLRPGRLDRIVYVPLPDENTRKQIFDLQLCKMPISKDVDVEMLVSKTNGYSGAEVLAVCHEAALKALEADISSTVILKDHFLQALTLVTPRTPSSLLKLYEEYLGR